MQHSFPNFDLDWKTFIKVIHFFLMREKAMFSSALCTIHVACILRLCLAFMLWWIAQVSLFL